MKCINCKNNATDLRFKICYECANIQSIVHSEIKKFMCDKNDRRTLAAVSLDIAKFINQKKQYNEHIKKQN